MSSRERKKKMSRPCIYCREVSFWNKEHVLPRAFGRFEQSPTICGDVCAACNAALSREVEDLGARETLEGLHRCAVGLVSPETVNQASFKRARLELDEPGWQGVVVGYVGARGVSAEIQLLEPQVLLQRRDTGRWFSFNLQRLSDPEFDPAGYQTSHGRFYFRTDEELEQLVGALAAKGVHFKQRTEIPTPDREAGPARIRAVATYDSLAKRLIAKIAFNYLAHTLGAHFALSPMFDHVRGFIREGKSPAQEVVHRLDMPFLAIERRRPGLSSTDAHLVALDRGQSASLVGKVSLFNLVHYEVVLAWALEAPDQVPVGHWFDWKEHRIGPLKADPRGGPRAG